MQLQPEALTFISIMPEVVFGVTATWNHNDFISICFSISTCEAGAAGKRLANLYEAVKGGGEN